MATPKAAPKVEERTGASFTAKAAAAAPAPVAATPAAAPTPVVNATPAAPKSVVEVPKAPTPVVEASKATTPAKSPTPAVSAVPAVPAAKTEEVPKTVEPPKAVTPEATASISGEATNEETARELPTETEALEQDLPEASPVEPSIPEYAEESNVVADLKPHEKKSLEEFKVRIEKAIKNGEFKIPKKVVEAPKEAEPTVLTEMKEVTETPETETQASNDATTSEAKEETKEAVVEKVEEKAKEVAAPPAVDFKVAEKTKEVPVAAVTEKAKNAPVVGVTEKPKDAPVVAATEKAKDVPVVATTEKPKDAPVVAASEKPKDVPAVVAAAPTEAKPTIVEKAKAAAAHVADKIVEKAKDVTDKTKDATAPAVAAVTLAAEKVAAKAKEVTFTAVVPPAVVEEKAKEAPVSAAAPVVEEKSKDSVPVVSTDEAPAPATDVASVKTKAEATEVANDAPVEEEPEDSTPAEDISLWGVPLLHTKGDKRTDVILLKFLRARDFNVNQAFKQLKKTIIWRKTFKTDSLLEEEFGTDLDGVAFMYGQDKEGHPVCYNVFGTFQDKELYQKAFGDASKITAFLRWRVQVLERGMQSLNFTPEGPSSMVQIVDMKNTGFFAKKDIKNAVNQATDLLQDNYPELVARKIFVNAPWYFTAVYSVMSPFLSQRTKSKFTVAPAGKTTEHLLKFIPAEHIPVNYGGLSKQSDSEFAGAAVQELVLKAGENSTIEIPITEVGTTAVWDFTVVGYEVNYGAEFIPSEGPYPSIIEKSKKLPASTEAPIQNSFRATEPGKIVLTLDNSSKKKKTVLYRYIVKEAGAEVEAAKSA